MSVALKRTTEFLPLILPYCPDCPDFVVEQMVRLTAIDFSERARAWRHVVQTYVVPSEPATLLTGMVDGQLVDLLFTSSGQEFIGSTGQDDRQVPMPAAPFSAIHEIEYAEFDGRPLEPVQFSSMQSRTEGRPRYITQAWPGVVRVFPEAEGMLELSLFLKPTANSQYGTDPAHPLFDRYNVVPEHYLSLHGNVIAAGALERILAMPRQSWTNMQEAARFAVIYQDKANTSFRANMRGQQRAPIRTRFRDF